MWSVLLIWLEFHRSWQKHGATHGKTVLFSVKQGVGGGGGFLDFLHGQVWLCSGLALLSDESANAPAVRRRGSHVHRDADRTALDACRAAAAEEAAAAGRRPHRFAAVCAAKRLSPAHSDLAME